ncbi:MAG: DUF309 domain-containing protein [Mycobacteriales bacterium]
MTGDAGRRPPGRVERDRDPTGRARNARPRDITGRPLARNASGAEQLPDELSMEPTAGVAEAQRLIEDGRPFSAHEVLEALWKAAPPPERDLWRGLAQLAVGLTHAQRDNAVGAARLLRRGSAGILDYADDPPYGLDLRGLGSAATELAGRIEREGLAALGAETLALRLTGESGSGR